MHEQAEYRADIDGLRALAVLLIVVYHVWLGRVSGGVDVFLMVSAFFLTGSFARRIQDDRPLALATFWARRFLRLVPAATATVLLTLGVVAAAYPRTEWTRAWSEAWSSLFYVENWALAFSGVDYYARDAVVPSPFQHFWSLSVQGQVFLLWPVLIGAVWLLFRQRRRMILPALAIVFSAVFALSLVHSISLTSESQVFAYFDTGARLWEFAAGSLVALAVPHVRLRPTVAAVGGWVGLAGIAVCGLVLDVQGGFPGYLALWPVVCTALVIIGGRDNPRGGPGALLASRPLRAVARNSYALYLVHWPVLITWMTISGRPVPGVVAGAGILVLSAVLAGCLTRIVERPAWDLGTVRGGRRLPFLLIGTATLTVAVPLSAWQGTHLHQTTAQLEATTDSYPGAAHLDHPEIDIASAPLHPSATSLESEWVELDTQCSGRLRPSAPVLDGSCVQTSRAHEVDAPRVLVIGDSHAQQLMSPLKIVAAQEAWELVALLKGGCALGIGAPSWSSPGPPCDEWRVAAMQYVEQIRPDVVYLVVTRASPTSTEVLIEGVPEIAENLIAEGIAVIAVRDNPRFDFDMYACVNAAIDAQKDPQQCAVDDIGQEGERSFAEFVASDGIIGVDFRPWLCPEGTCYGVIGNVAIYIDDNHTSDAYGRTLAPMLARMLDLGDGGRADSS
ncbi:acyltransferase family protein [Microbacterium sp. LS_15]